MTNRVRLSLLLAVALGALAAWWASHLAWFVARLDVPYPLPMIHRAYLQLLADLPRLLLVAAAVLAAVAAAMLLDERRAKPGRVFAPLEAWRETALFATLLAVDAWLSWRHFVFWGRPRWDEYWQFGQVLHFAMLHPDAPTLAAVQSFCQQYPHSPSPLTPLAVALGLFFVNNSLLLLQIYSLAATAASVFVLRAIFRRLAPSTVFWPLGVLFLTNAATARNAFFIQLDAINGFLVLLFFLVWLRWREQPTRARLAALTGVLVLAVFQKTTLFPLLAIPTSILLVDQIRARRLEPGRLLGAGFWTALVPLLPFAGYLAAIGIGGNFQTQVALMGTGWNELDFSWARFLYATGFLLGPYLALIARHRNWREPAYQGSALFVFLFFASIVAVRGPFWGRYYSHVIGACVLLALPAWAREADDGRRLTKWTFLGGIAILQWLMVYWQMV